MKLIKTKIPGPLIIKSKIHRDHRGYLRETFKNILFKKINFPFEILSYSKKNVLRGLHLQTSFSQDKILTVTKGKIFAKGGAEGVLLFAHKEKKIGGVIKVSDGNERALPSVANEIFNKLKILNQNELNNLSKWSNQKLYNHAKINIGKIYTEIK